MKSIILIFVFFIVATSALSLRKPTNLAYCPQITGPCMDTKCPNGGVCVQGECCKFEAAPKAYCHDQTWNCPGNSKPCDAETAQMCMLTCGLCPS
uniref:ShKT domain-containing protein n=1 Tax=Panagrolaimus sp. PS1159 TaxID=55785 RepID=A0AC35F998_9BILA